MPTAEIIEIEMYDETKQNRVDVIEARQDLGTVDIEMIDASKEYDDEDIIMNEDDEQNINVINSRPTGMHDIEVGIMEPRIYAPVISFGQTMHQPVGSFAPPTYLGRAAAPAYDTPIQAPPVNIFAVPSQQNPPQPYINPARAALMVNNQNAFNVANNTVPAAFRMPQQPVIGQAPAQPIQPPPVNMFMAPPQQIAPQPYMNPNRAALMSDSQNQSATVNNSFPAAFPPPQQTTINQAPAMNAVQPLKPTPINIITAGPRQQAGPLSIFNPGHAPMIANVTGTANNAARTSQIPQPIQPLAALPTHDTSVVSANQISNQAVQNNGNGIPEEMAARGMAMIHAAEAERKAKREAEEEAYANGQAFANSSRGKRMARYSAEVKQRKK